jgi:prepilin-type N-terminal cleavage/methylation domain-containing protein
MKLRKFTLAEIMIVVAVLAVVASIALPEMTKNRQSAVVQNKLANIKTLESAILCYLTHNPHKTLNDVDSFELISPFLEAESKNIDSYKIAGEVVSITDGVVSYIAIR